MTSDVKLYAADALQLCRLAAPSDPHAFFAQYFASVQSGTIILWRPWSFVISTPLNRAIFCQTALHVFENIALSDMLLEREDLLQLLRLLCNDCPPSAIPEPLVGPLQAGVFLRRWCVHFLFARFFVDAKVIFDSLADDGQGKVGLGVFLKAMQRVESDGAMPIDWIPSRVLESVFALQRSEVTFEGLAGMIHDSGEVVKLIGEKVDVLAHEALLADPEPFLKFEEVKERREGEKGKKVVKKKKKEKKSSRKKH